MFPNPTDHRNKVDFKNTWEKNMLGIPMEFTLYNGNNEQVL